MTESKNEGHRQRLRDRFASGEESSRSEEALLELLLTYSIPQKDVQPLAKRLLAEYGRLSSWRAGMSTLAIAIKMPVADSDLTKDRDIL